MNVLHLLKSRFKPVLAAYVSDPEKYLAMIRPAGDTRFGDFQANFAMPLAGPLGRKSREIADEIAQKLDLADLCQPPEVAGPGFINLRLHDDWVAEQVTAILADDRLGAERVADPRTVVVDYSSPNVAKPMHVGHLRSSVIGSALYRVFRFVGHRAISDNHIGDWGTQFGMIIYGYKNFLDSERYASDAVGELARLYRLVNQLSEYHAACESIPKLEGIVAELKNRLQAAEHAVQSDPKNKSLKKARQQVAVQLSEAEEALQSAVDRKQSIDNDVDLKHLADAHPTIAVSARNETAKLHSGDEENVRLWERFLPECLKALQGVYDRLGIEFDLSLGESFYQPMLADVVKELRQTGLARESDGAICIFVPDNDAPFIVQKTDGAFTYGTTDFATVKYRVEELHADQVLYVVDTRQSEHFKLLFATTRLYGYDQLDLRHVNFGTVLGDDKRPFKTRSGDTVGLESLIDEAITRARRIVDENDDSKEQPELPPEERTRIAEIVGVGGIKYADLRHNRESDYVFSWDKMLATQGDTATYMQYAYARICGIFRKGGIERESVRSTEKPIYFTNPEERALALQLLRFADAVDDTVSDCRPNILTAYLFETSNAFSAFYNASPVLKEPSEEIRDNRLRLCDLTARVLERGLDLLGIGVCEKM